MKITNDFIGNETKELTKTKIATILRWWGFNPDSYSTWGNARSDMNNILSESSSSTISDREHASSFLSKINYINDTDTVIGDMLFASNEPGVWYDPSDLSTLFQDVAGTIPVTGVEQPVGLMLDKSGRGNHASQPTTTARPILRARYNLLTQTEDLGHADWAATQQGTKCTVEQVQAPDGSMTAQKLTALVSPTVPSRGITVQGSTFRFVVWLKPGSITAPRALVRNNTTAVNMVWADTTQTSVSNQYGSCSVTSGPDGWKKFTFTVTSGISPGNVVTLYYGWTSSAQIGATWSVWRPDFRYLNDAFNSPEYQRVGVATDYDTAGFRPYLAPDGTDDWMVTGNIDLSSTSDISIVAGAKKLNELAPFYQALAEFGPGASAGSFTLWHPYSDVQHSRVIFRGSAPSSQTVIVSNAPGNRTDVLTTTAELGVFRIRYKVSGTQYPNYVGVADPGSFGNLPLYLFSRAGTSTRFRGAFYGLIVVGRLLSAAELALAHEFMRNKSRAY